MQDRLTEQIDELARQDRRYPAASYMLVFEGLEHALARLVSRRHVTPVELVRGVRDAALEQFGLLAREVLRGWNITRSGDVGELVFNLIDRGLLEAGEDDSRDQFEAVLDFDAAFDAAFLESLERDPPRLLVRGV